MLLSGASFKKEHWYSFTMGWWFLVKRSYFVQGLFSSVKSIKSGGGREVMLSM
jgi:hypothetical protein